jgi:DNA gyrase subunit A
LSALKEAFGDARRTQIVADQSDVTIEDLIERQDLVVTLSHAGYAKTQPVTDYEAQRRGGKGKMATTVKDEDFVDKLFIAHSHDTLLCFSDGGQCYWLKVYQLPLASRGSRGKPIVNLLQLSEGERITAVLAIREFDESHYVFMATAQGTVKKTPLSAFSRPRANGIIALSLEPSDCLVGVALTDGQREILLTTTDGKAIRFAEDQVRPMGREAAGVRGIKLAEGKRVTSLIVLGEGPVLTVSERGYGKLTEMDDFPRHGRAGQGVIALQTSERNGTLVGARQVRRDDEVMLINSSGTLVRVPVSDIPVLGRNTQGVRIMRLEEGEKLVGLERIAGDDSQGGEEAG